MNGTMVTPARKALLDALVKRAPRRYPELREPLTWLAFRRLCERSHITVQLRHFAVEAEGRGYLRWTAGRWTIVIDEALSDPERCLIGAHEFAHRIAHHADDLEADEAVVFDRSPEWYGEVKEAEANYLAERMIAGPDVISPLPPSNGRGNNRRTTRQEHAAADIPLRTRKPAPDPTLPDWLEGVDRDGDEIRIGEKAQTAARADAQRYSETDGPLLAGPTVQFSISREAWLSVRLDDAHFPHYETAGAGMFEFVTCTLPAARSIVEQLARAGHKRTAVFIRRRMREAGRR